MPYFVDFLKGHQASVNSYQGKNLRIGRGTNADLRFDDASVALEHAVIKRDDAGWSIRDRGSVTGTFVNGERVDFTRLADGDRVDIGIFRLKVEVLGTDDPLFLHVAPIGEGSDEDTVTLTLNTLKASGADLLAMVEMAEATRRLAASEKAASATPEDTFATLATSLLLSGGSENRSAPSPAEPEPSPPDPADTETAAPATPPPAPSAPRPRAREIPRIDYARVYRLDRGLLNKSVLTALLFFLTAGGLLALFERGRQDVFSPGPLTHVHRSVTNDSCAACHPGWRPVAIESCQSSNCHDTVGDHQTTQLRDPSCLECHTEHRDLQALRLLLADGGCVACHAKLRTIEGDSQFASRITGFGVGEHPVLTPRTDPGALEFHHAWHLTKVKRRGKPVLTCESCHIQNDDGEVDPVIFEEHCQECHNLSFDQRFGGQEAPHASPDEVLTYLAGYYSLRPEVLGRLTPRERRRLLGRNLDQEEQLAEVAEENARALVRTKCLKCHHLTQDPSSPVPLAEIDVRPTRLRDRWLEHAAFSHTPHLEIDMSCDDCHVTARASRAASNVLLPEIKSCRKCHRAAKAGEGPETATLGRIQCIGCHTYHPEPRELDRTVSAEVAAK